MKNLSHLHDMLIRIKNSYMSRRSFCIVTRTRKNIVVLTLLVRLGYIIDFQFLDLRFIKINLAYYRNQPAIRNIQLISKSRTPVFMSHKDLQHRCSLNYTQNGFFFLSTVAGIVTDLEALSLGLGGELLFEVI